MGRGPTVFVRSKRRRRVSREEFGAAVESLPKEELKRRYDRKVHQAFLEQDNTKGRGRDDKGLLKRNFHKFDGDTIRRAAEGKDE